MANVASTLFINIYKQRRFLGYQMTWSTLSIDVCISLLEWFLPYFSLSSWKLEIWLCASNLQEGEGGWINMFEEVCL